MKSTLPSKKNILVIDDHQSIRYLLGAMLSKEFTVTTLKDGIEGLAWMMKGNIPDLILLDMEMPKLGGEAFLKHVKNSGFSRNIPVIILSGNEDDQRIQLCKELGALDYLKKPFNPFQLKDSITSAMALDRIVIV